MKVLAWLAEEAQRCNMCGTADYEWDADKFAYVAHVNVCRGCALREQSSDLAKDVPGGSVVLLSGEAKKAALDEQRRQYLASRKGG